MTSRYIVTPDRDLLLFFLSAAQNSPDVPVNVIWNEKAASLGAISVDELALQRLVEAAQRTATGDLEMIEELREALAPFGEKETT